MKSTEQLLSELICEVTDTAAYLVGLSQWLKDRKPATSRELLARSNTLMAAVARLG